MKINHLKHSWEQFSSEIGGKLQVPLETNSFKIQVTKQTEYGTQIISGMDLWGTSSIKDPSVIMTSIYSPVSSTENRSLTITKPNLFHSISTSIFGIGHIIQSQSLSNSIWIKSKSSNITANVKTVLLKAGFDHPGLYIFLNRQKKALITSVPHLLDDKRKLKSLLNLNDQILDIINEN